MITSTFHALMPLLAFPLLVHGLATVTTAANAASLPYDVCLSGSDWRIHEDADSDGAARQMSVADCSSADWIPASVPGNIQADLETAHRLKPLWYGELDPRLYEVAQKNWWYRKDFQVPPSFAGKRLTLVFDGVDHECEVWLNGRKAVANTGMFRRFWFDVGDVLKPGATNRLAVRIAKIPDELAPLIVRTDGAMSEGFVEAMNLSRQVLKELKSPTNFGWDWGVNIWTLGIWKDVHLVASGPARIDWTQVQTRLEKDYTKAIVTATLEVDSLSEQTVQARFEITGNGQNTTTTVDCGLKQGLNQVQEELSVEQPALWWCNGQGPQPLYVLEAQLRPTGGGPVLDARTTRFGIREVRWVHTEGAPQDYVSRFQLVLNGREVRTMGSCLIPPDLLFGRACPRGLQLLERAKDAGMTMLRIWGGGIILPDLFYAKADELGIMLSVEFPIANCLPETNAVFLGNLETTIRNVVKQVRNHPAIIEYTGGNEMSWNSLTQHPAWELFQRIVREEDQRLVRATCPDLGAQHSPWDFSLDTSYRHYDEIQTMRYGEFGTSSPANLEVWQRTIPPKSQWPIQGIDDPILIRKNVVQAVFSTGHWLLKNRIDAAFGALDNLPDLIQAGQFLGAEGLRYAVDALRRKGRRLGGFTSWDYNEPWLNGAGSYLVDYDGRPLMNYDFVKQALAPISLSLKYDSLLYDPREGLKIEVWLASDAARAATGLHWKLLARDRRGKIFSQAQGVADIEPLEAKSLQTIRLAPPPETGSGPVFVEMQLLDAGGQFLTERLHVFGLGSRGRGALGGLLVNRVADANDEPAEFPAPARPDGPANVAFVGNGAQPATASSEYPGFAIHRARGLNDGRYGNDHSWIANGSRAWFQIDLGKVVDVGLFKLGRDRTGKFSDRGVDYLKLEVSLDGQGWQTIFEQKGLTQLPGYDPTATMSLRTPPTRAQWIRATVDPANPANGVWACVDEFEVYAAGDESKTLEPRVEFTSGPIIKRHPPVRRTELEVRALPVRVEGTQEVLELIVQNRGSMTALFCAVHPLLEYRTDLAIDHQHCFIPPAESRTITIRSSCAPPGGLGLAQTGWRLESWNADDRVIEPSPDVLLAVGRRDQMCREFAGYGQPPTATGERTTEVAGRRPDPAALGYLLSGKGRARFRFEATREQTGQAARLRIHLADQDPAVQPILAVVLSGRTYEQTVACGLGLQKAQPYQLAFPVTAQFDFPAARLNPGENTLEVGVANDAWVTLDAIDLISGAK